MKITLLEDRIQLFNTNLCKEIMLTGYQQLMVDMSINFDWKEPMVTKYKFSRSKWHEAKLHKNVDDALDWCEQQFGKEPNHPDAWSRWYFNVSRTFRFRDEKDYAWFMLRWS